MPNEKKVKLDNKLILNFWVIALIHVIVKYIILNFKPKMKTQFEYDFLVTLSS